MGAMRLVSLLLLAPLLVSAADDDGPRLGCGFGSGMGITDEDGDGFGSTIDCDDSDPDVHPDADEYCDGIDNDCDGKLDEDAAVDAITWYEDYDHDDWGFETGDTAQACSQPDGYGPPGDCYDVDPRISPDADELCDGVDNDCDGLFDEDPVDGDYGCLDADGDGYGDPEICETSARSRVASCSTTQTATTGTPPSIPTRRTSATGWTTTAMARWIPGTWTRTETAGPAVTETATTRMPR